MRKRNYCYVAVQPKKRQNTLSNGKITYTKSAIVITLTYTLLFMLYSHQHLMAGDVIAKNPGRNGTIRLLHIDAYILKICKFI